MVPKLLERLGAGNGNAVVDEAAQAPKIVLVGNPNVGKSVVFGNLTGTYVTVSNYPGTTVEVARGRAEIAGCQYEVIDTPGMYSMLSLSDEERVTRRILMEERPKLIIHVVDAKNLERMLLMTFSLVETGFPVILVLNIMDEAEALGLRIDSAKLESELGIPVVPAVSTSGRGTDELRRRIAAAAPVPHADRFKYSATHGVPVESYLGRIEGLLNAEWPVSRRCLSLLLLQKDEEVCQMVRDADPSALVLIQSIADEAGQMTQQPLDYVLTLERRRWAGAICARTVSQVGEPKRPVAEKLSRVMMHPVAGLPILAVVLYFGLYKFVGGFGAGTLVDFLQGTVFEKGINPYVERIVQYTIPWQALRDLIAGDYGIITLGLRYALAIILPIVTLFFLVFAIIEDVGYLPRLALLLDRLFKKIGLSGRAVIPMVLGFGCDTMATMVTRTLSTKREQLIAILLLTVAIPCSAQLGVIIALLSGVPGALLIWAIVIGAVYIVTGTLASRVIPGRAAPFYVEIPPLRWPQLSNIARKTFARVKWYLKEVIPLFMLASVAIWLGQLTGLFKLAIKVMEYPVRWIGLPSEAAKAFLFGFFRRDYGVAGLYDLSKQRALNGVQLVVAAIALTLFLPCVAHFLMTAKEKGWKSSLAIAACTLCIAFGVSFVVLHLFAAFGVSLQVGA